MNDQTIRSKMDKVLSSLDENLRKLRTGRASTALLEGIKADVYETSMPIEQIATISTPDFKSILIQPWDKGNIEPIVKAITIANLGFTPIADSDVIRVNVPDLTEERRKELSKVVGTYEEEAKVALRQVRKEGIESYKNDKEATEDDIRSITEDADKIVKEYNEKVAQMCDKKRDDMMEV